MKSKKDLLLRVQNWTDKAGILRSELDGEMAIFLNRRMDLNTLNAEENGKRRLIGYTMYTIQKNRTYEPFYLNYNVKEY